MIFLGFQPIFLGPLRDLSPRRQIESMISTAVTGFAAAVQARCRVAGGVCGVLGFQRDVLFGGLPGFALCFFLFLELK